MKATCIGVGNVTIRLSSTLVVLCALFSAAIGLSAAERSAASASVADTKTLLRSIVSHENQPPAGRTAKEILPELTRQLASPDPELRDDLAFRILSVWIYEKRLLSPDDLRSLVATLLSNLRRGIGEQNADTVFFRSFSALTLSIIVARDNEEPFLSEEEFRSLLNATLTYFRDERDTRGFDGRKGWIHTVAHTSDLLKFLARSRYLSAGDQGRILEALVAKLHAVSEIFGQGEDQRMARVVISIARRSDLEKDTIRAWFDQRKADVKFPDKPSVESLRFEQNTLHFLVSLWAALSIDNRPSDNAEVVKGQLRDVLRAVM
jgi:Protein of unknown function (DUF2785)